MNDNNDKIIEKIKKLLDLANYNPNKNESIAAALKAQQLMAKYHFNSHDIEDVEITEEIIDKEVFVGKGNKWKLQLASIIGKNFCCKAYKRGSERVVFYGYEKDTEIASSVFSYLFKTGNKLANKEYITVKKELEDAYGYTFGGTKGVKNQYLLGFFAGIETVLDKQCTALMLIVPEEVEKAYLEKSKDFKGVANTYLNYRYSEKIFNNGKRDGIDTANARSLKTEHENNNDLPLLTQQRRVHR